jgi:5-methylcytosine-specific restriction endonuclease McrA
VTRRLFSDRQRRILAWVAAGQCQRCGKSLSGQFHADHITPYALGGKTVTNNGQALCAPCNLEKGAR